MSPNRSSPTVLRTIFAAAGLLTLLSCGRSPLAPGGLLLVYVAENGDGPSVGKAIELRGTSLRQTTDENGIVVFTVPAGRYVVRAYDIGTPGPGLPFVEQSVTIERARTSRAEFNDCTMCRSPSE